ncbi:uncharacterized protein LOC125802948 isoform X5 [Astyanax mexicanus]|uniref:uncharacterized protein LOC125802948 isoform X5 n=1 Tax=Astyanax mexicanus TaxID=7994 RepID=UPI0020CB03F4|nr:uncharacterized protein LOC125802948 isoform X5 [Astyanax mexicanus]
MCSIQGILGAAGVAALAVAVGGSFYYLYRSRTQKPTTTEETTVTPVEGDPETVAEPMVEPVLPETVMELVEVDGGVDCPQEEDQVTIIMDEAPEAPSLLQVTGLAETEEAEVIVEPEICESVVETQVEDGGVDCKQEKDLATLIVQKAIEDAILLLNTDLAETEEAEVIVEPEICESVVETQVEDGGVDCKQEKDLATLIVQKAIEDAILLLNTDLAETEDAEVIVEPELCVSVVETLVEDGGVECPQEEDQATLIMDEAPEAPSLLLDTDPAETEEDEVIVEPELCVSVVETLVEDGGVDCKQEKDLATLIVQKAIEDAILLLNTDLAETEDAKVIVEPELCVSVVETLVEDGGVECPQEEDQATLIMDEAPEAPSLLLDTDPAETEEAEVIVEPELCVSVVETLVEDGGVDCPQEEDQATLIMDEAPEAPSLLLDTDPAETEEAEVIVEPELCVSVVETLVEDGGVDCKQEKDLATLIVQKAIEDAILLLNTDLAETEDAKVIVEPELCVSVVETLVEDGGVDCPQEEDQATLIMDEAPEDASLLLDTDPAETEEAEVIVEPELCVSVVETLVEDEGEEDEDEEQPLPSVYQLYKDWPSDEDEPRYKDWPITKDEEPKEQRQPRRKREREISDKKDSGEEAEVTVEPELCESVVETLVGDGEVTSPQEDQATLIVGEGLEAAGLLCDTDPAETKEAETKAECRSEAESKKKPRRRGTRGKGRKINYK